MTKLTLTSTIITCQLLATLCPGQINRTSSTADFFPLWVGLKKAYVYSSDEKKYESLLLTDHIVDSGTVDFNVVAMTANDSALVWDIKETDNIIRHAWGWLSGDTSFVVQQSQVFQLRERNDSMHSLDCVSAFPPWQFPSRWSTPWGIDPTGQPVSRFSSDLSEIYHVDKVDSGVFWFVDTLIFGRDIGLTKAVSHTVKGPNTPYYFTWKVSLVDSLTAIEAGQFYEPPAFTLDQNYPNPFNPQTIIGYRLLRSEFVSIRILDPVGREVATLVNRTQPAGYYSTVWDGIDARGNKVSSGVYFYQIRTDYFTKTRKLTYLR